MPSNIRTVDVGNSSKAYYAAATSTTAPNGSELIHISGQVGTAADGTAPADYDSQIHLALLNLRKVLVASEATVEEIVKLCMYIVNYNPEDRRHAKPLAKFLRGHRPACTLVPVPQLAQKGWKFEIEATVIKRKTEPASIARSPSSLPTPRQVDVVVIGAGLAGLTAAHEVLKAGYSCIVLEARDRVGGRTHSKKTSDGSGTIDLGAAWINDVNQTRMIALARRFNVELIEQNTTGDCSIQDDNGNISSFPYGDLPKFNAQTQADIARIRDTVEADCQTLSVPYPATSHAKAKEWDNITFLEYLRRLNASPTAIRTATVWTRAMLGHEPENISALFFLNYCKSGGGLLQMRSDRTGGGQHLRIRTGTQTFAKCLAAELPEGVLQLSSPVAAVTQVGTRSVFVETSTGQIYRAQKVVSAAPHPVLKTITFDPPLPDEKRLLIESYQYGHYQKVMVLFRSAFWKEKGYCGLVQSFIGPAAVIRDTSSPEDNKHVLTCFVSGSPGATWSALPQAEREAQLLHQISEVYHTPPSTIKDLVVEIHESSWEKEDFTGYGGPSPALTPGVLDSVGHVLREPFGSVHFAGTETSEEWKGYMEGAVRSGERAGKEVVAGCGKVVAKL